MKRFLVINLTILIAIGLDTGWCQQENYAAKILDIKVRGSSIKDSTDQVRIKRSRTEKWESARKGLFLYPQDLFVTLEAEASLEFNEAFGSGIIKLNKKTAIQIQSMDAATSTRNISLQVGEIWAKVKGYFKVKTVHAEAGTAGTEFLLRYSVGRPQRTDLFVFDGTVFLTQEDSTCAVSAPGSAYVIGENPPLPDPKVNLNEIKKSMKKWADLVQPNKPWLLRHWYILPIGITVGVITYIIVDEPNEDAEVTIKVNWR